MRVRPAIDYDVLVDLHEGVVSVRLSVIDVSVEGLGLVVDEMFAGKQAGELLPLVIRVPGAERFEVRGEIRYSGGKPGGKCGVLLKDLDEGPRTALARAVGELLERGNSA